MLDDDADTDEDAFNGVDIDVSDSGKVVEEMVGNDEEGVGAVVTEPSEADDGALCGDDEELASSWEETSLPKALSFLISRVEFEANGFSEQEAVEMMDTEDPSPEDSDVIQDAVAVLLLGGASDDFSFEDVLSLALKSLRYVSRTSSKPLATLVSSSLKSSLFDEAIAVRILEADGSFSPRALLMSHAKVS